MSFLRKLLSWQSFGLVYGFKGSTGLKVRPQFPEQGQVVQILILKSFFPRTGYMQGLPDISSGPLNWWPEELCVQPIRERQRLSDLQRRNIRAENGN
jgi:hypothetical protein